jgi:hypothetical protein
MNLVDLDLDQFDEMTMARQQQQQPQRGFMPPAQSTQITKEAVLCIPPDQLRFLPRRAKLPGALPIDALPRMGEAYYPVDDGGVWAVELIQNRWVSPTHLRIEVWIVNVDHTYPVHKRPPGFEMTQ